MAMKEVWTHPKFKALKMRLGLADWQAVGLLESVWGICVQVKSCREGLIAWEPKRIAAYIGWSGDAVDMVDALVECGWLAPLFMPRWASRITLLVKSVRVERVQAISYNDAIAEGWHPGCGQGADFWFEELWDSINAKKHPWSSNPWVWVIEFERKEANA